jgi:4-hydroxybenzoate polyprenyltransferase
MFGGRTTAMGFNRLVDQVIDSRNPRTAGRALVSGELSRSWALALTLASAALFIGCAAMLHPMALKISPAILIWLWGYSLAKRFTSLCHLWLGAALGLAPVAVWIALTGQIQAPALVLAAVVCTWVAGFDILYALQDRIFDDAFGLRSIPVKLGERRALWVSRFLHIGTVGFLFSLPHYVELRWPYWLGVAAISAVLIWEHSLIRPDDHSQMNKAFFTANSYISLLFFGSVILATI